MLIAKRAEERVSFLLTVLTLMICLVVISMLTGCGGASGPAKADAYTVDATMLSSDGIEPADTIIVCAVGRGQAFRLPDAALAHAKAAIQNECYVGVILADGSPSLNGMRYELTRSTEAGMAKEVRDNTQDYLDYICSLRAEAPGIRLLESMNMAANELRAKGSGPMTVCVVTSGVTDGTAAMTPELVAADHAAIVSQLVANGSIADYGGITFRFYGVGQSTGEQAIPDSTAAGLRDFWGAVIRAGGGDMVFCTDVLVPLGCDNALPSVTVFDYPADNLVIPNLAPTQKADLVLGEDILKFEGDLPEFADYAQAEGTLRQCAETISVNGYTVSIAGYTADSPARSPEFLQDLSEQRAQAVALKLVELGVDRSAITAVTGFGPEGSTSMATGKFDEAQAKLDRKVVLTICAPT